MNSRVNKNIFFFSLLMAGMGFATAVAANLHPRLSVAQSRNFRQWFLLTIHDQAGKKPNPRWVGRDCAGLVRFAVKEALTQHDAEWVKNNGMDQHRLPPEMELTDKEKVIMTTWRVPGMNERQDFAMAGALIQENTDRIGFDLQEARPGDLLFFDQETSQHIMIWTGRGIAYHTGSVEDAEKSIKVVHPKELHQWQDSRWWPVKENPNFRGVYRFSFLSY